MKLAAKGSIALWPQAALSLALMAAGGLLTALVTWLLAGRLGSETYGEYAWAWSVTSALGMAATLGLDAVILREVSRVAAHEKARARELARPIRRRVATVSAMISGVALAAAALAGGLLPSGTAAPLLLAVPAVPLLALSALDQAHTQALGRPAGALVAWTVGRPATLAALVVTVGGTVALDAERAAALATLAAALAWAASSRGLQRGAEEASGVLPEGNPAGPDDKTGLALLAVASALSAHLAVVAVGAFGGTSDAGLFAVALQLTVPFVLIHAAVARPLAPVLGALEGQDDRRVGQATLAHATRRTLLATALPAAVMCAFAEPLLGVFGSEFRAAATTLQILLLSHIVNAFSAFNRIVLLMGGLGGVVARATWASLGVAACSHAVLIPAFGASGGAAAVLVSVTVRNALLSVEARRTLGLRTSALARLDRNP